MLTFVDSTATRTITGSSVLKCNTWYRAAFVGRKTQAAPQGITLEHEMLMYIFDDGAKRWKMEVHCNAKLACRESDNLNTGCCKIFWSNGKYGQHCLVSL
jgi:hypothetical protein